MFRVIVCFITVILFATTVSTNANNEINIGLLLDNDDNADITKDVFYKTIEKANKDLLIPLKPVVEETVPGNVFDTSRKLCNIFLSGATAIFGPSSRTSAKHLVSICDAKEIPYIDTHIDFAEESTILNLHPHPRELGHALYDILVAYDCYSFTFLYESGDWLAVLDELTDRFGNDVQGITIRRYDFGLEQNYYNILRGVRKSDDNTVVIVGSIESIRVLLKQAQEVGMITSEYRFIVGNLDFHTLDLQSYQHSDVNVTSIRLVSPENDEFKELAHSLGYPEDENLRNISCPITTSMACLYDAVQIFAEITKHTKIPIPSVDCADDAGSAPLRPRYRHSNIQRTEEYYGFTIGNFLTYASHSGLTGKIEFTAGMRTGFSLEVIELTPSGLLQVGIWDADKGFESTRPKIPLIEEEAVVSLVNKTFIVLTAISPPYGMLKTTAEKLTGNDQYEGFGIELIQRLAEKLGFNYTFKIQEDGNYGSFNATTNQSSGMLKELIEGNAHMAITDLTITSERELGVDFTIPFMNLGISILFRKPQKEPPKLFSFMDPFSKDVWLYLGAAYVCVSLSLFILGRISPDEWDNPYPCIEEPTELENQFSLSNSFWFTVGALLQQGTEIAPKAPSTRTVASIWWFFTIILVSSYTANLAAFLTVESLSSPIENVDDLAANKGGVQYGAKANGATFKFFENSKKYEQMYQYMKEHPELMTTDNHKGVDRVMEENYAFLMESTSIEYNVERKCNLTQVGGLLDEKGYGIAMKKGWPYRDRLSYALLELQEAGILSKMKTKWWKEVGTGGCTKKSESEGAEGLGMPNLGGVYFVLLVGSIAAAGLGVIKWLFSTCFMAYKLKVPIKTEIMTELKFVMDCSQNTKSVKTTSSQCSRNSSITMESMTETNSEEDNTKLAD